MATHASVEAIEAFHLVFLKLLETRLDRAWYVVKGGVNLRAWFGSALYSEALDLDIVRGQRHALEEKVDRLLVAPAFNTLLASQRLSLARTAKPKQTETTQRWKFEIQPLGGPLPLHTRVEFSRRGSEEEHVLEAVRPEIVRPYGLSAPTANHYTARAAIRQKIEALAGRAEPQARDIWDLDHLLRTTGADPRPLPPRVERALPGAVDRALELPFDAFRAEVVPFLAPDHQEVFGTARAWTTMCEHVASRLTELLG